jgi:transposase
MGRKHYPSDISVEQFERIRGLLEGSKKRTCPRRVDLYDVFCAILYLLNLLKNAAVWRALPSDFPPASTVRYYFDQWSKVPDDASSSLLEQALKKSVGARTREQRQAALDELLHRGRTKREEHRYGQTQGL